MEDFFDTSESLEEILFNLGDSSLFSNVCDFMSKNLIKIEFKAAAKDIVDRVMELAMNNNSLIDRPFYAFTDALFVRRFEYMEPCLHILLDALIFHGSTGNEELYDLCAQSLSKKIKMRPTSVATFLALVDEKLSKMSGASEAAPVQVFALMTGGLLEVSLVSAMMLQSVFPRILDTLDALDLKIQSNAKKGTESEGDVVLKEVGAVLKRIFRFILRVDEEPGGARKINLILTMLMERVLLHYETSNILNFSKFIILFIIQRGESYTAAYFKKIFGLINSRSPEEKEAVALSLVLSLCIHTSTVKVSGLRSIIERLRIIAKSSSRSGDPELFSLVALSIVTHRMNDIHPIHTGSFLSFFGMDKVEELERAYNDLLERWGRVLSSVFNDMPDIPVFNDSIDKYIRHMSVLRPKDLSRYYLLFDDSPLWDYA